MAKLSEPTQEAVLAGQVARSVSAVKKKDMAENGPVLDSSNLAHIDFWSRELLVQAGPKDGNTESYPAFFALIPSVIRKIGTHGFKLPNPDVSTPPIFSDTGISRCERSGVLHERLLPESLIYSGDASQIRLAKFLMAKINLDGKETTVLHELIDGEKSPVTAALVRCGMPVSACNLASEFIALREHQDLLKIAIHPLTKQVFFEEEGLDDVILIPVAPESMIAQLHSLAQWPGRWLASRALCAVGGANPVNGGSLCSDLGGAFQLLKAEPPSFSDQSLAARLSRGGRVYTRFSVSETDVLTFVRSVGVDEKIGSAGVRDKEIAAYRWFAEVMLAALVEADFLVETGLSADGEEGGIARYLQRNRNEEITVDLATGSANDVFDMVIKNNKGLREHVADVRIREVLLEKMVEVLL